MLESVIALARCGVIVAAALVLAGCNGAAAMPSAIGEERTALEAERASFVLARAVPIPPPPQPSAIPFDGRFDGSGPVMRAHFIDVGQGCATLFEFPCGLVLVDAGGAGDRAPDLRTYLDGVLACRGGERQIDALFVTHPHIDHDSFLISIANRFAIGSYIDDGLTAKPGASSPTAGGPGYVAVRQIRKLLPADSVRGVLYEDIVAGGNHAGLSDGAIDPVSCHSCDPRITVLSGGRRTKPSEWTQDQFENENNHSLLIRVDFGAASFLIPGDLEEESQSLLTSTYAGTDLLDADVLQVPHHGAKNGCDPRFLGAVSPVAAVISCGRPDEGRKPNGTARPFSTFAYGHPTQLALARLDTAVSGERDVAIEVQAGERGGKFGPVTVAKQIRCTAWEGTIVLLVNLVGDIELASESLEDDVAPPEPAADGRCEAITQAGTRCKRKANDGGRFCWQHDRN